MAPVTLDPDRISVSFNGSPVCIDGAGAPGAREVDLSGADIEVTIDLGVGAACGEHPHHRPVPRLRRRELGVQLMTLATPDQGAGARRGAAVAQAAARQDRRGQVRRQRDDRRRAEGRVRRRHGVPAQLRHPPRRRARRRPADQRDAQTARHRRRFQGRLPRHHAGGARRGADGAVRPGRPRAGEPDQRARPVRRRHHR